MKCMCLQCRSVGAAQHLHRPLPEAPRRVQYQAVEETSRQRQERAALVEAALHAEAQTRAAEVQHTQEVAVVRRQLADAEARAARAEAASDAKAKAVVKDLPRLVNEAVQAALTKERQEQATLRAIEGLFAQFAEVGRKTTEDERALVPEFAQRARLLEVD
jgi:hypothetical protein